MTEHFSIQGAVAAFIAVTAMTPLAATAAAAPAGSPPPAVAAGARSPLPAAPPKLLPGDAQAASVRSSPDTWIVAGRRGSITRRIAARFGARVVLPEAGAYVVGVTRARPFAAALAAAGRFTYAEPDAVASPAAFPADPLAQQQWWIPTIVDVSVDPAPVTASSPVLGIVDEQIDLSHPEFQGSNTTADTNLPVLDGHGTAVAAVAGAPANGAGIVGVWPGMRIRGFAHGGFADQKTACSRVTAAVRRAIAARVRVINMSYTFPLNACFSHLIATELAISRDIVLVAASGNELARGNQPKRPALDPNVLTIGAFDRNGNGADFSSQSFGVDLSAPGVGILVPKPFALDQDGDGSDVVDGTSFASPMAAAVATEVRQLRPNLTEFQVRQAMRAGAEQRDLGPRGYDVAFGYGALDLPRSLQAPALVDDPAEPNDDAGFVNGRLLGRAAPALTPPRSGTRRVLAFVDRIEDPVDVYRLTVPAGRSLVVRLVPRNGFADLALFRADAETVAGAKRRISRSRRAGQAVEQLKVANPGRRGATVLAVVTMPGNTPQLNGAYRLELTRSAFDARAKRVG